MCCQDSKPVFKGVVVTSNPTTAAVVASVVLCLSLFSGAVAIAVDGSSITVNTVANVNYGSPYCVYLEKSQELDCVCEDESDDDDLERHSSSQPMVFPGDQVFLAGQNGSIASVKLHSCRSLHVRLDLRAHNSTASLYRFRAEDVNHVTLDGVTTAAGETVDVWLRNVNGTALVRGPMSCHGCKDNMAARVNLHLVNARTIELDNVVSSGEGVVPRIQVRDADSLVVRDSYFR